MYTYTYIYTHRVVVAALLSASSFEEAYNSSTHFTAESGLLRSSVVMKVFLDRFLDISI